MGYRLIQQKNGPLITEIAKLNLERMAHWNFNSIGKTWKMAHNMVCPVIVVLELYIMYMSGGISWVIAFIDLYK